ncbi:NFACT family protein [Paenibacillus sp. N4]|uniref:Fpg/Nei family DNA glycosylase n=1 Tax=Paenibacillus vietnamensis TaxID=2590547 RepID=UPI001CD15EB9|nr:DNA-formamidopyrimidine glycosylase family protein [Paenibacillus vietnamensis]MCA0757957.1 NFACT family protein [Paenibacillus vietnamensis]
MQELPELDHYRNLLADNFSGAQITAIDIRNEKAFQVSEETITRELIGSIVWYIERRSKYLLFHLDNGRRLRLSLHQGAYLYSGSEEERPGKAAQVQIRFGSRILYFIGLRLNDLQLLSAREVEEQLATHSPDPFHKQLTLDRFIERFARKRGPIKSALMDQSVITGIGTVYSDEICYSAAVRPDTKIPDLSREQWEGLYNSVHKILKEAVSFGGTGEHPFSADDTVTGGYAARLHVYNREGQTCSESGAVVEKIDVSGRAAYYCPEYQKS